MSDPLVRLAFFLAILAIMVLWELRAPLRTSELPRRLRWTSNLGLSVLNSVLLQILVRSVAPVMALVASEERVGLFNTIEAPFWLTVIMSLLALDMVIYFQHRLFHRVPVLWRLHRMHHADTHLDATSGLRFHPLEAVISMAIKAVAVILLGAPALAALAFEVLLNGTSIFNHANVRIPRKLDAFLRLWVVTPDMHRVHHSIHRSEHTRNFGFNLSCWDRLFNTYKDQPELGHQGMTIGLPEYQDMQSQRIDNMLAQPWLEGSGSNDDQGEQS